MPRYVDLLADEVCSRLHRFGSGVKCTVRDDFRDSSQPAWDVMVPLDREEVANRSRRWCQWRTILVVGVPLIFVGNEVVM